MSEIAVIGEHPIVTGFALAGARVCPAREPAQVLEAWEALPDTVAIVLLTPAAAQALRGAAPRATEPLTVVMSW